jgi:hypothetical protein
MPHWKKALALSMLCSLASSCGEKRVVTALPIPAERMDCAPAGKRPAIPPEHVIQWDKVTSVLQARSEHDRYKATVRDREGRVAGYVLELEGQLFACSSDAQWIREWQKDIAE